MKEFTINKNYFLNENIKAFYHTLYLGYKKPNNPDFLNTFKNTYNSFSKNILDNAAQELENVLKIDLLNIRNLLDSEPLIICVVPRAKKESSYKANQLLFKKTIQKVTRDFSFLVDGTDFIQRHTNTRTTHLPPTTPNYNNDGKIPYAGITSDTCKISDDVHGKNVLLIDDIYTKNVCIDEDALQALLNKGVKNVFFYAVGYTL